MEAEPANRRPSAGFPPLLFVGFAIASIGGPLALPNFLPGTAGDEGIESAGFVVLLALAVFAAPLVLWLVYSRRVVSPGGLTAFVEAAAGRRAALVHGWIWAFAYFLYLPYTITFVVYDVLAPIFPGLHPYRWVLELVLLVAIVVLVLAPVRLALAALVLVGPAQLVLMLVLGGVTLDHVPVRFAHEPSLDPIGRGVGGTALLFICASLPLYLGAEVRGGSRTVRRGLVAAVLRRELREAGEPCGVAPDRFIERAVDGYVGDDPRDADVKLVVTPAVNGRDGEERGEEVSEHGVHVNAGSCVSLGGLRGRLDG